MKKSLMSALIGFALCLQAHAATFTVTNTNDSGTGSLRKAINDAVAATVGNAAHDTVIAFNIPGTGVHTIQPASQLPPIKDLLIDGYTQPGSRANTLAKGSDAIITIEIDGINAGPSADGLQNQGTPVGGGIPNATIRGLAIGRFGGAGIVVNGLGGAGFPGFVFVQGCYIGTDASGTQPRGNGTGILFSNDGQGVVGEFTADFSGNPTPFPAYRNVISGNIGPGISFESVDLMNPASGTVRNAYIGTDPSGLVALGNGGDGISIKPEAAFGSQNFGAPIYLYDNLISANLGSGIETEGVGTQVVGNTIGYGIDGRALGNQNDGVYFHNGALGAVAAVFSQIGVVGPGIAHNGGAGVRVADNSVVDITGPIYGNVGLDVDLGISGVNTNDAGDADTGPNELLNNPVIVSAVNEVGGTRIQGTINTRPNSQVELRLYMNSACHPMGSGGAERSISTAVQLTANSSGNATFDRQIGFPIDTAAFPVVVAQARRVAEGTFALPTPIEVSEFSPCVTVTGGAPPPTLGINDVTVTEGNAGTSTATFTVTLSAAAAGTVTVNYATANGTATAGSDYVAATGTLTFTAGQTTKTVAVTINGDTTVEPDETFVVNLSAASGATIADAQGTGTITNDDVAPLPTLSISDVSVAEGNAGTTAAAFTVTLSAAASSAITVNYATVDITAAAGSDYTAATGTLTFAIGETTKTVTINVTGDATVEPAETFGVDLSVAVGATIAKVRGTGTITNDDVAPPPGGGGGGKGGGSMDALSIAALALCLWLVAWQRRAAMTSKSNLRRLHSTHARGEDR